MLDEVLQKKFDNKPILDYCDAYDNDMLLKVTEYILPFRKQNIHSLVEAEDIIAGIKNILGNRKFVQSDTPFFLGVLIIINFTNIESYLKYMTIEEFLTEYNEFKTRDPTELLKLWKTASWMDLLFKLIPAKGYFGLALAAVSKLVQGPEANYVTGKGQMSCVDDREYIYRKETQVAKQKRQPKKLVGITNKKAFKATRTSKARHQLKDMAKVKTNFYPISKRLISCPHTGQSYIVSVVCTPLLNPPMLDTYTSPQDIAADMPASQMLFASASASVPSQGLPPPSIRDVNAREETRESSLNLWNETANNGNLKTNFDPSGHDVYWTSLVAQQHESTDNNVEWSRFGCTVNEPHTNIFRKYLRHLFPIEWTDGEVTDDGDNDETVTTMTANEPNGFDDFHLENINNAHTRFV